MRVPYCCDSHAHEQYYVQQAGGGLPVFAGARVQQGHGIGNVLGGLVRMAIPLLKSGAGVLKREAVKAGVGLAGNLLKKGTSAILKRIAPSSSSHSAAGYKGIKRQRTVTKPIHSLARAGGGGSQKKKKPKLTRKIHHTDIFQ